MTPTPTSTPTSTDLLGRALTPSETEILRVYDALKDLVARDDLSPCAARNARKALAAMWQVANDLDLRFEQLYELGV